MQATLFEEMNPPPAAPFSLRLAQSDVRITNPHVADADPNDDIARLYETIRDENHDPVPELSESDRAYARSHLSVARCYVRYLKDWRNNVRLQGKIKSGTLQKELQSLRCFDRWDADPGRAPDQWPRGVKWTGLPIGYVAHKYVEQWARSRLAEGYAVGTMEARWCHLRTVLNMIRRMGVIETLPDVDFGAVVAAFQRSVGDLDDDLVPTTYTAQQHVAVYNGMHEADLRAAWVIGSNAGPRTVDLFSLRWSVNVRFGDQPHLLYTARKTGKRHWVPLHPITIKHMRRLVALQGHLDPEQPQGLVFPRLTSSAADPEKGRVARARNDRIKRVMMAVGIDTDGDYEKPWQVLRATCNSLLNNHRAGTGQLVTHGKDADVSSQHYWNHHPALVEAIATMPMPAAFDLH